MRSRSCSLTSASFARNRFPDVCRFTANFPFLSFPLICVKPRKSNVSGLPSPLRFRSCSANCPNSTRRVLSGCSSKPNLTPTDKHNHSTVSRPQTVASADERPHRLFPCEKIQPHYPVKGRRPVFIRRGNVSSESSRRETALLDAAQVASLLTFGRCQRSAGHNFRIRTKSPIAHPHIAGRDFREHVTPKQSRHFGDRRL
jgi:hypothetical protein